jgi:hypothetical protein
VARAEYGKWSSLPGRLAGNPLLRRCHPAPRDPKWLERVTELMSAGDVRRLRNSVTRERRFA